MCIRDRDNNPGTDGKLFSDNHPYQAEAHKGAKKAVDKLMARIDEMFADMPDYLTGEEKMAIARNNREMEKALKIKKGKPMDCLLYTSFNFYRFAHSSLL